MGPLLRRPVSAGARPGPGRPSLDSACAPAVTWQLSDKRDSMISQIEVSTLSGEPRLPRRAQQAVELSKPSLSIGDYRLMSGSVGSWHSSTRRPEARMTMLLSHISPERGRDE
jgi:hypothetical protein